MNTPLALVLTAIAFSLAAFVATHAETMEEHGRPMRRSRVLVVNALLTVALLMGIAAIWTGVLA